jgi:hypothetical protein
MILPCPIALFLLNVELVSILPIVIAALGRTFTRRVLLIWSTMVHAISTLTIMLLYARASNVNGWMLVVGNGGRWRNQTCFLGSVMVGSKVNKSWIRINNGGQWRNQTRFLGSVMVGRIK